jgi:hypothetical protein
MAHSFDVFDAAGTHACSCQSNGGRASNFSKMHCNTGFSSTDINFTIHFIIVQKHQKHQRSEPCIHFLIYAIYEDFAYTLGAYCTS